MQKDFSISFARFFAMIFIITCHIMQYHGFVLAWWFNVGVQMFLFISGYLYGNRKIVNSIEFYKKTFKKILLDYEIYIVIFIFIVGIFSNIINLNVSNVINLLTFSGTVIGVEHLWFIPLILFCYLIVPIISQLFDSIKDKSNIYYSVYLIILVIIIGMSVYFYFKYFNSSWVNCFVLGMIFSRTEKERHNINIILKKIIICLAIVMNVVQIYIDYFSNIEIAGNIVVLYSKWCNYAHVFLGILCVLIFRKLYFSLKLKSTFVNSMLDLSDKYSYDIYIVHQIYILGPLSIFNIIESKITATLVIILLIIISSIFLRKISEWILRNWNKQLKFNIKVKRLKHI